LRAYPLPTHIISHQTKKDRHLYPLTQKRHGGREEKRGGNQLMRFGRQRLAGPEEADDEEKKSKEDGSRQ
jgi:hypothetical protein